MYTFPQRESDRKIEAYPPAEKYLYYYTAFFLFWQQNKRRKSEHFFPCP